MKTMTLLACLGMALLAGCHNQPATHAMPEVNEANCEIERIKKIEDKATRETFAGLCSRRSPTGGGIGPTKNPMNWLELTDPKDPKGQEVKP